MYHYKLSPFLCSRAKQSSFTFDQAVLTGSQRMEESFTIHLGGFGCYGYITHDANSGFRSCVLSSLFKYRRTGFNCVV